MGPPREHGGMKPGTKEWYAAEALQWGRRVNTAEWNASRRAGTPFGAASMGPPREHGGMAIAALIVEFPIPRFNGAAA